MSTLQKVFRKTKTFLENLENRHLVESTKIENVSFSYKTAMSKGNVKTNKMESMK